jgi:hypothetical protein
VLHFSNNGGLRQQVALFLSSYDLFPNAVRISPKLPRGFLLLLLEGFEVLPKLPQQVKANPAHDALSLTWPYGAQMPKNPGKAAVAAVQEVRLGSEVPILV